MKKTIDHINRDKMDNRRENLRFANMSEQNSNKDKQKRQKNACKLPDGILQTDLPIYVCYNNRCYNKENNSWREFFTIHNHPKLDRSWESSKSNNVSIHEKLEQAKLKLQHLNGEITNEQYKKIVEPDYKLPKGFRIFIDKRTNKYTLCYENRAYKPSINLKMVLSHNDLQLMLDNFIDLLNNKYKNILKTDYYKLEKHVLLDFSNVNNEILEQEIETENETENIESDENNTENNTNTDVNTTEVNTNEININTQVNTNTENNANTENNTENNTNTENNSNPKNKIINKYKILPILPPHFSIYKEGDNWCLGYSKFINKIRYSKRFFMNTMCIQTELNRLIDEINKKYPELNINKYTIENPYDFTDTKLLKVNSKPIMPTNFSICNINNIEHIQFCKKINNKRYQYKYVIKSYNLQNELNVFIADLNKKYNLNISEQIITDMNNWKTTNKII